MTIGILAYGSLLDDPGPEFANAVRRVEDAETPFRVEFARKSEKRDGAPTLIPVEPGGETVPAGVLVLKDEVAEVCACEMLYRRETRPNRRRRPKRRPDWIRSVVHLGSVDMCLYAAFGCNLESDERPPAGLAQLAIKSAKLAAGAERRDGISYLEAVKHRGVETPLMADYEHEILKQTDARSLSDAWARARAGC
jgi:hypothetical protein